MTGKKKVTGKRKATTPVSKPQKVYKDENGKVIYRQSTDKVGDVLVNQAGVKYKITGEIFHAPSGYDDGKLKIRILELTPEDKRVQKIEIGDSSLRIARSKKIFVREKPTATKTATCKRTAKPNSKTTNKTAKQSTAAKAKSKKK